jgi:anti-sigma B factor antagonist
MTSAVTAKADHDMTGDLTVSVSAGPSCALVTVAGECDITTAPLLLAALSTRIAGGGGLVVVDLSALRYLDAAGIHALLAARSALASRGRSLALASPQRIVSRMLELTRASHVIPVYRNVAEALDHDRRGHSAST